VNARAVWLRGLLALHRRVVAPPHFLYWGFGAIVTGYGLALWGWYAFPAHLADVEGSGWPFVRKLMRLAAASTTQRALSADDLVRLWQYLAPVTALAGSTLILTGGLLARFETRIRTALVKRLPQLTVLLGDGPLAETMFRRCAEGGRPVLWLLPRDAAARIPACGAAAYGALDPAGFRSLWDAPGAVEQLVLLDADPEFNQVWADRAIEAAQAAPRPAFRRRLFARVDNARLRAGWGEKARERARAAGLEIQLAALAALEARALVHRFGLDRLRREPGDAALRLALCGFGDACADTIESFYRLAHFRRPRRLSCYVVGATATAQVEAFWRAHPQLRSHLEVVAVPGDVDAFGAAAHVAAALGDAASRLDAVYVWNSPAAQGSAAAFAHELVDHWTSCGWHVPPLYRMGPVGSGAETAGLLQGLRPEDFLSERFDLLLDRLPRETHERYVANALARGRQLGATPALVHWDELPADYVDENRAQADHSWVKARDLHARIAEGAASTLAPTPAEIEELGIAEHERWSASRRVSGWTYAAQRDDARRLHTDLVPWEQLSDATRQYDRDVVSEMPAKLAGVGCGIARYARVALEAATAEPLASRVAEARAGHPGQPLLLSLRVRDADELARAVAAMGWPETAVELVVDRPLHALRDALGRPGPERLWQQALREAWAIVVVAA
jgi:hypothetical protein